jgi:NTE family protein
MFNRTIAFAVLLCLATAASGQRVGLVLSGGGATAMAHIGVMKALEENNIPIDFITGSSMGALVGGLYAAGYSPWQIDSLFSSEQFRIMAEGGIEPEFTYFFKQDTPDASLISLRFDLDTLLTRCPPQRATPWTASSCPFAAWLPTSPHNGRTSSGPAIFHRPSGPA